MKHSSSSLSQTTQVQEFHLANALIIHERDAMRYGNHTKCS